MAAVWTHGVWTVRPGREDDFVAAWTDLVPIGVELGSGEPRLLRDRDRPNLFRSFGPWPDLETIERFRTEIGPHVGAMSDMLENFETFTLDEVFPGD
jgi:hypothetical protein